jgi:hypothetical protein
MGRKGNNRRSDEAYDNTMIKSVNAADDIFYIVELDLREKRKPCFYKHIPTDGKYTFEVRLYNYATKEWDWYDSIKTMNIPLEDSDTCKDILVTDEEEMKIWLLA